MIKVRNPLLIGHSLLIAVFYICGFERLWLAWLLLWHCARDGRRRLGDGRRILSHRFLNGTRPNAGLDHWDFQTPARAELLFFKTDTHRRCSSISGCFCCKLIEHFRYPQPQQPQRRCIMTTTTMATPKASSTASISNNRKTTTTSGVRSSSHSQQHCWFLISIWVVTVLTLTHCSMTELRELQRTKQHQQHPEQRRRPDSSSRNGAPAVHSSDYDATRTTPTLEHHTQTSSSSSSNDESIMIPVSLVAPTTTTNSSYSTNYTTTDPNRILTNHAIITNDRESRGPSNASSKPTASQTPHPNNNTNTAATNNNNNTTNSVTEKKQQSRRRRLILHVGPSKTATTTLQTDLTRAQDRGWLHANRIVYMGRYYRPLFQPPPPPRPSNSTGSSGGTDDGMRLLILNRSESNLLVEARRMRHRRGRDTANFCCIEFLNELEAVYQTARSEVRTPPDDDTEFALTVILSDENFGNMWLDPSDYQAIAHATQNSDWEVIVVAGYRRFYEWIVSSKYQRDRTDRIGQHGKELWPSFRDDPTLAMIQKGFGRELLPMFPDTFSNWRQWYRYTDSVYHHVNNTFPVRLINMHHTSTEATTASSLLTQFLCDTISGADQACALSRQHDILISTNESATKLNSQEQQTIPSLYYDALATAAAGHGLIDTEKYTRKFMREKIRAYHEETLLRKPNDLILQCPTQKQLDDLYTISLSMENRFISQLTSLDAVDHFEGFQAKVATGAYCWINTTTTLSETHWLQFFQQFASSKTTSLHEQQYPSRRRDGEIPQLS